MAERKAGSGKRLLTRVSTGFLLTALGLAISGCCSVFNICPPAPSQTSYYDALKVYSTGLNKNVFNNDPNFVVVPATGIIYPIGTLLINGNGVSSCLIDKSLVHGAQTMAPQPPVMWSTSGGLSGTIPASMLGGLASAGLSFKTDSSASLSMVEPITADEVSLDDFTNKIMADPACRQAIDGRKIDLVRGTIDAREKWSWQAGQTASASENIGPSSAGPSFSLSFANGSVPVAIEETSPSPRFFIVTPIPAQSVPAPKRGIRQSFTLKVGGMVDPSAITALAPR